MKTAAPSLLHGRSNLETLARETLDDRRETPFSDEEWAECRRNLVAFVARLATWEAAANASSETKSAVKCPT